MFLRTSHPSWVCGLKRFVLCRTSSVKHVTPFVGVWIETSLTKERTKNLPVTPFVGVWIETLLSFKLHIITQVTPFVGVWIETRRASQGCRGGRSHPSWVCGLKLFARLNKSTFAAVTPFVGVWIETSFNIKVQRFRESHPSWVCGLKPTKKPGRFSSEGHTLRGCVD